ncbi:tetratricopeptide (TPR) repeat protein [Desulfomicrobium macestii]|uniref:Tetratricopeptide (TPR) repeat protein n=1 Tax=Desulfomicrobium macestii TaxID=90731 RepID=A0ABR9H4Y9_9BACT|nr:hypothetical protein [Desulfomicrobium macestii]MBE1425775.1 tetratricopeptide (TPR) repeat protein [Desulfomicrobium macestii]
MLQQCLSSPAHTPPEVINALQEIVNRDKQNIRELFAQEAVRIGGGGDSGLEFKKRVFDAMDRRQFKLADELALQVAEELGEGVEMVVRTGSSGSRHMQLSGNEIKDIRYDLLVSDDDISFVGARAKEAAERFNVLKKSKGLGNARCTAFSLSTITDSTSYDLLVEQIRNREAFVGAAGFGRIRQEMVEKGGAVILTRKGGKVVPVAQTVQDYVAKNAGSSLAEIMDVATIAEDLKKFGPLTMYASAVRQMEKTGAQREKVKYLLRIHAALDAAGSLGEAELIGGGRSSSYFKTLGQELKDVYDDKTGQAAAAFLKRRNPVTLQSDAFEAVMLSTTRKLQKMVAQAEKEAGKGAVNIAGHPELRRMIREMAAGFALFNQTGHKKVIDEVVPTILRNLGSDADINLFYKVLYTATFDAATLSPKGAEAAVGNAVAVWTEARTAEGLVEGMRKAGPEGRQLRQTLTEVGAKRLPGKGAEGATQLRKILAEQHGDDFLWKMLTSNTAKKFLVEGISLAPFAAYTMYQEWQRGEMKDLSTAAFVLIDFVPGGMSVKSLGTEGLTPSTVLMFAKEALYFTPAWPFVLAGDVLYLSWTVGGAIQLQSIGEGLVDVLVYTSEFEDVDGKPHLKGVSLPDGQYFDRDQIYDFLFKTKAVKVRHAISGFEYYINNLSEKSFKVLDEQFVPNDATVQQMRLAIQQHLDAINWSEASKYFSRGDLGGAWVGYLNYLAGFEFVVKAAKGQPWARLYEHLKQQMADRRTIVAQTIMVPQLILMAEEKRATLDASRELPGQLAALQEKFEQMRGSSLEVRLADVVGTQAGREGDKLSQGTAEDKLLASGEYWQNALNLYQRIWNLSVPIQPGIEERTGYSRVKPLGFAWTGDPVDDLRKAEQSKEGFALDLGMIRRDLIRIAKHTPDVNDPVDGQAFEILCGVVFPWRTVLDASDNPGTTRSSAFEKEYAQALEKVRALYGLSLELQDQVDKGAILKTDRNFFVLDTPLKAELLLNDKRLAESLADGSLKLTWSAGPHNTVRNDDVLHARITTPQLEPVTITVLFEQTGVTKAQGALALTLPVRAGDGFLSVSVQPAEAAPGQKLTAVAAVPERFFGDAGFGYRWRCENCELDARDLSSVGLSAGKPGKGAAVVDLVVAGPDGEMLVLASGRAGFVVQDQALPPKTEKEPEAAEGADKEQDKQKKTVEADPQPKAKDEQEKDVKPPEKQAVDATPAGDGQAPGQSSARPAAEEAWFKSSLSGGWKIEHNRARLWAVRMTREIAGKSDMCRPQTVRGTISAKLESSFVPKPGEIDAKLRYLVENNGFYPDEEGIQSFSIGKYKGRMITTTFKYKNGFGNPMAGYRDGTAHSFGYAIVLHETERRMISVNFSVSAGSCWDNSGKDNALAQVKAARGEALGIIQGLSLHETEQESPVTAGVPVVQVEQADEEKEKDKKYQLTLTRVSPASGPVIVGIPVTFKATLSGDKPEGEVRYQFEPHPDVAFTPHEGPSASTTAVFSVPGKVGVWVTAVDKTGTIATSDQLEIEIQKPVLELSMEPKAPFVGQEVKARLTVKPEVKDIDFRWMPVPGNAKHISTSKDNRELVFYLKDEKAAEIQVSARVPFSGEDLGEAKASVAARKYAVTVSAPKAQGPPPRVWKEGVGLVTVDKAIAVDQIVEFSVALQPAALSGPVKYQWKVENGPCRVSNPSSSVARVTANAAGTCELSVTVRDRNDVELGVGQGSFSASVTQEAVRQGEQKAQAGGEAQKLVQNAPAKARKGDYDGAIGDAEEAARLDPKNTAAKALADKLRSEKERIHAQLEKTRKFMEERRYNEAQRELTVAQNLNTYYPPIREMEETLRKHWSAWNQEVNQKNYEIREAIEKKEFGKALEMAAAWRTSTVIAPHSEKELKQNENWARKWQTQKMVQVTLLREAGDMVKEYDYAGAVKRFEQGFLNWNNVFSGIEPEYREARELQARAAKADKRLREIVPLLETVIKTKTRSPADIERGTRLADEAVALQPNNQQFAQWRDMLRDEAAGAASGQSGPAGSAAGEQAARELWQEAEKLQLENDYVGALQKYREGLKLHADPAIENRVKTLEKYVAVTKGSKPATSGKSVQTEPASTKPVDTLPAKQHADATKSGSLVGEWEILSPGHKGKLLILEQGGAGFSGRAYPDQPDHDTVIEGLIDGTRISFVRTGWKRFANLRQDFTGTLGVDDAGKDVMKGSFSQNGKGSTTWSATRVGPVQAVPSVPEKGPAAEAPSAAPPAAARDADVAPAASSINMLGEWNHVGNGHTTKLIVGKQGGNAFSGVMHGNPLINGLVDGNKVTFTRDIPQRQDYTGTLTVGPDGAMSMSGTFTQKGSKGLYKWSSSKPAPQEESQTAGQQTSPPLSSASPDNEADAKTSGGAGWKAVTIGNVSFAVPASWGHKTMKEPSVEELNLYWDGSFDAPLHGLSGGVSIDYARAKSDLSGSRTLRLGGVEVLRVDDGPAMNLLFPPMSGNRGVALVVFRGPGGNQATIDALLKTFRVNGQAVPGDGKALTTGQKYREGMRWVSASNPGHYLERRTTAKGVRWIEHDGGKVLFEFEEKGGSSTHGSVTIFDPSRNISGVLYPDRFEFSRDGRKLGSHQGGWK